MAHGAAPVYSIAGEGRAQADSAVWARFVGAEDESAFFGAWLALLAAGLGRPRGVLLLVAGDDGAAFTVAAAWPDSARDLTHLGPVAQQALGQRNGVVVSPEGGAPQPDGAAYVGYPVESSGRLCAAVVADLPAGSDLQAALRQIHWASAW